MTANIIEVRTDLYVSAYDYLEYKMEYGGILTYIHSKQGGYISQSHLVEYLMIRHKKTKNQADYVIKKLVKGLWLSQLRFSPNYNILYLSKKSRTCIYKSNKKGLPEPSNRTIIRSLLLSEYIKEYRSLFLIEHGTFTKHDLLLFNDNGFIAEIILFDVSRRSEVDYRNIFIDLSESEALKDRQIRIRFLCYSCSREETLLKVLKGTTIQGFLELNKHFQVDCRLYNLSSYFKGYDPLI